jgi:hypothetical protein
VHGIAPSAKFLEPMHHLASTARNIEDKPP